MRIVLVVLAVVAMTACTVTYHDKRTVFEPGSLTNSPDWTDAQAKIARPVLDVEGNVVGFAEGTSEGPTATGEVTSGEPGASPAPRGTAGAGDTGTTLAGSPGCITVNIGQNDGVEQKADAAVDAKIDATVTP